MNVQRIEPRSDEYEYLGNFSATPPWFSVSMSCDDCRVSWTGCWDNFQCPRCGKGDIPWLANDCPFDSTTPIPESK